MFISITLSGKKLLLAQLVTLIFLLALPTASSSLNVGDELCIQGFIMDYFCVQNVKMIDTGRVTLEEPERHTVHCLVDVGICLESAFEVLVESSSGNTPYRRGYRLDDGSKSDMIDLARSVGSCSTCANGYDDSALTRGFKAVMKVTVLDLNPDNGQNAPPLVRVNERKDSSDLGSDPCQSQYDMEEGIPLSVDDPTAKPTPPPTRPPTPNPTTAKPTPPPTRPPTPNPTTAKPTSPPTRPPTSNPTSLSTQNPAPNPSRGPTPNPIKSDPTRPPTPNPTLEPNTPGPSVRPTASAALPIQGPTGTTAPSDAPSLRPLPASVTGSPTDEVPIASPTTTFNATAAPSTKPPAIATGGGGSSTTPDPTDSSAVIGLLWSAIIGMACAIAAF